VRALFTRGVLMDWKKEVGIAFLVRQQLSEVFPVWPLRYPNLAATDRELAQTEQQLGPLDPEYAGFLRAANGWEAFLHRIGLFGTADLLGSPRMDRARELLSTLLPLEEHTDVTGDEVLPVAVSVDSIDVVLLGPSGRGARAKVYWWAGTLVDVFPSFSEYFLTMVDLTREEIAVRSR
jgi:hypothetical protein